MTNPELTLDEWLDKFYLHEKLGEKNPDYISFPSDQLFDEYLISISTRSEKDVKALLRNFLIHSCNFGIDDFRLQVLKQDHNFDEKSISNEYNRRLVNPSKDTWEGITWILDLLSSNPQTAISVIRAYNQARYFDLPDPTIQSLNDAIGIISARYLETTEGLHLLNSLTPRDFEFLIAGLYLNSEYEVSVTKMTRDGGYDVILVNDSDTKVERLLIECKLHKAKVGVQVINNLNGVLGNNGASRGVVVTNSKFSRPAIAFARKTARIELIDGLELCKRLNIEFGSNWLMFLPDIIMMIKKKLGSKSL